MAHYVDGFVIPLPKKRLNAYRRLAQKAGEDLRLANDGSKGNAIRREANYVRRIQDHRRSVKL